MSLASKTGVTHYATPTDQEIVITRVVDAPRRVVFDAWTKPEHVQKWMLGPPGWSMPVCEIDLRNGGRWHFVWRKTGGEEMDMSGLYREVVPPERLSLAPDCGLWHLSRDTAFRKTRAMALAAEAVRTELGI